MTYSVSVSDTEYENMCIMVIDANSSDGALRLLRDLNQADIDTWWLSSPEQENLFCLSIVCFVQSQA